jgi:hypothetical protein
MPPRRIPQLPQLRQPLQGDRLVMDGSERPDSGVKLRLGMLERHVRGLGVPVSTRAALHAIKGPADVIRDDLLHHDRADGDTAGTVLPDMAATVERIGAAVLLLRADDHPAVTGCAAQDTEASQQALGLRSPATRDAEVLDTPERVGVYQRLMRCGFCSDPKWISPR